jgi:hypothetical protein
MNVEEFVAQRATRLERADADLLPVVTAGLERLVDGDEDWADEIITEASVLWLEVYLAENPGGNRGVALARFRREVTASLDKTATPSENGFDASANRVTYWLSGYTVNNATTYGAFQRGVRYKRWATMGDSHVREMHDATDGQIVPIGGTFDVGGNDLAYPGQPVGPPDVWINCRCLAMPAARDGETMSGTTYTIGPEDDVLEVDNPDIVTSDDMVLASADADRASHEVPVHGVLAPEGVPTGDGREFALGSLSTRTLPVPLRYEIIGTHGGMTSEVVTVGRVDEAWRNDATNEWEYRGVVIDDMPHAEEVLAGLENRTLRGVSIDGDDAEIEVPEWAAEIGEDPEAETEADAEIDVDAIFNPPPMVFRKMRVAGLTIVPIPAFQEAYIALGHEFREVSSEERERLADDGAAMPDGSYPIANCEDLANAIQAIGRASDPDAVKAHIRRRKADLGCDDVEIPDTWGLVLAASAAPIARLVEPEVDIYPSEWFANPNLDRATPLRIDKETRRVYGHVAAWGTCHVGMAGMCQDVPKGTDYGFYLKGLVDTDAGEQPVGCLTFGGHASENMRVSAAAAFYDKPEAVRAYVNVGEDAHGIWFAGVIPPDVTDADIAKMRAIGAVSGDWREVRGNLELIGVPVVNTPGFPIRTLVASAGRQITLIGAGAVPAEFSGKTMSFKLELDPETVAGIARTAVAEYRHQEQIAARAEPARAKVRERRLAAARAHAQREG